MWKVSWFYEKVHNIANFGVYTAVLLEYLKFKCLITVIKPIF